MQSQQSYSAAKTVFAVFVALLLVSVIAQAQKFRVLHTFPGAQSTGRSLGHS